MTYRVTIDKSTCNGYGNCAIAAPRVFDLDPRTNVAFVLDGHPVDEDSDALEEAEADCPARAITLSRGR
jgi:ferredoxin